MLAKKNPLTALPNIGAKLASMLHQIGVQNKEDISRIGAAKIYNKLQCFSAKRLPICYYLYSLEAAVQGIDWRDLSESEKKVLRQKAGLE